MTRKSSDDVYGRSYLRVYFLRWNFTDGIEWVEEELVRRNFSKCWTGGSSVCCHMNLNEVHFITICQILSSRILKFQRTNFPTKMVDKSKSFKNATGFLNRIWLKKFFGQLSGFWIPWSHLIVTNLIGLINCFLLKQFHNHQHLNSNEILLRFRRYREKLSGCL